VVYASGAERRALQLLGQLERPRGGATSRRLRFRRRGVAEKKPQKRSSQVSRDTSLAGRQSAKMTPEAAKPSMVREITRNA